MFRPQRIDESGGDQIEYCRVCKLFTSRAGLQRRLHPCAVCGDCHDTAQHLFVHRYETCTSCAGTGLQVVGAVPSGVSYVECATCCGDGAIASRGAGQGPAKR